MLFKPHLSDVRYPGDHIVLNFSRATAYML